VQARIRDRAFVVADAETHESGNEQIGSDILLVGVGKVLEVLPPVLEEKGGRREAGGKESDGYSLLK